MKLIKLNRLIHQWASIVIVVPFIVIVGSGSLLLLKKEIEYIQPSSSKGIARAPSISFDIVLAQLTTLPEINVSSWEDIDRLDVRPSKGIIKVQTKGDWEIQLDAHNGDVLKVAIRRSDIIEAIHDGTYWQDSANLWLTLPLSIVLLFISITGIVLFFLPYYKRARNRRRL